MTTITFSIPGAPVAWARARQFGKRHFTAPKVAEHKRKVARAAKAALVAMPGGIPVLPASGAPVSVACEFIFEKPPSWSKKKTEATRCHVVKPDVDNLAKLVLDACNDVIWEDDCQVMRLNIAKSYGPEAVTHVVVGW